MNINLIAIGKTDNKLLISLIDEYIKRLGFYVKFSLNIIPDIKNSKNLSEAQQKQKEGELILNNITPNTTLILLDENGKENAIFTGDTLFIGDVGRPDLAVKQGELTEEDLASHLYDSLREKIVNSQNALSQDEILLEHKKANGDG